MGLKARVWVLGEASWVYELRSLAMQLRLATPWFSSDSMTYSIPSSSSPYRPAVSKNTARSFDLWVVVVVVVVVVGWW